MSEANPTRVIPSTEPTTEPMRRMEPAKVCPGQRTRIAERVRKIIRP